MATAPATQTNRYVSMAIWTGAAALLLLPAVAMRFTREVNWTASDFVVWGIMLASAGGGYELLARREANWTYRLGAAVALGTAFLLVWVNLAVGIIGSEQNDANMMYAGVLAVAIGGASLARFRSAGMSRAMLAAALAQVVVAAIALATGAGLEGASWPRDVIGGTVVFTGLWLMSGALFRRAG